MAALVTSTRDSRIKRPRSGPSLNVPGALCYNPRVFKAGIVAGVWVTCLVARTAAWQSPEPAPTLASSGVYTAKQAARGKDAYALYCSSCHNLGSQSGEPFAKKWNGVRVSELMFVLTDAMPKDDPGLLTPTERVDVIAYLLKLNDLAAGEKPLPEDPALLKNIVIDLVK
jgi:mono/diheme cytochrome c family protein